MKKFIFLLSFFSFVVLGQQNYSVIDLNSESNDEFSILDSTLKKYTVYFTGENHLYPEFNASFQLKFLKYLHQNHNVNHYIWEQSPALGFLCNQVMFHDTNNDVSNYLKKELGTTYYSLIIQLKKYNETVDSSDKIFVHGIDLERFPQFSIFALNLLVDSLNTSFEGGIVVEQIRAFASANYDETYIDTYYQEEDHDYYDFQDVSPKESLLSILSGLREHEDSFREVLKDNADLFYAIVKSLEQGREWYLTEKVGDVKSPIIRERFMCDEFSRLYNVDSLSKYYGQFGRCHIYKDVDDESCYRYHMNSIANRIEEIGPQFENKVLGIPIYYARSKSVFDENQMKQFNLEKDFIEKGNSIILDVSYLPNYKTIDGFYNELDFVIISAERPSGLPDGYLQWSDNVEEIHFAGWYGYRFFNKINKLNNVLVLNGHDGFTNKFTTYTGSIEYLSPNYTGGRMTHTVFLPVSNNQNLTIKGFLTTIGGFMPYGNKWLMAEFGYDMGYGQVKMIEETIQPSPNLLQSDGKNISIYTNDMIVIDPNITLSFRFPALSFNLRTGYAFDISSKYWRIDGKQKSFTKTSFTAPYIQAGVSLYIRWTY